MQLGSLWLSAVVSRYAARVPHNPFTRRAALSASANSTGALPASDGNGAAPIHVTSRAAEQLRRVASTGEHLRVSVDSGGCSGFEYKLTLDNAPPNADDVVIERDGARVVVDEAEFALSLGFIRGSKLDFAEDLMRSSFRITDNPAATQGCSCGSSFAPKSMS